MTDIHMHASRPDPLGDMPTTDATTIAGLLNGDDAVFAALVAQHHPAMLRLALMYVADSETAKDVIQETWMGVLRGLPKFEGRSSLKTWIFSILVNRAKTAARRERRYVEASLLDDEAGGNEPVVAVERFNPSDHPQWPHHWVREHEPADWGNIAEDRLLSQEVAGVIEQAINALPRNQREVIMLRDLQHWSADEVCEALAISEANQRVLLHRARAKVRQALEEYLRVES